MYKMERKERDLDGGGVGQDVNIVLVHEAT